MRTANIKRDTRETRIQLALNLDGTGRSGVSTGVGFLDHMLELFARHGDFDLDLTCRGDTQVDFHHSVEDSGICLGRAFAEALGDKRGITRYASTLLPMDEALILTAVDISGRGMLCWDVPLPTQKVGSFDTELAKEFWLAFVRCCPSAVHIRELAGENTHHILEAVFKGMGRTLKMAVSPDEKHRDEIPSTKGVL